MSQRTVAVIDGNSLIHRAFHALPPVMTAPDGRPTNAAYGFTTMLLKLMNDLKPDGVVVAFDRGRPAFRTDVLEAYKIHRPPTAHELKVQFPMVRDILAALGVPAVDAEGWEADDLLGTLAAQAKAAGVDILLVTGDRDALQLVEPGVLLVTTKKGITDIIVYDEAAVLERYGVTPAQVPDYLGLKGDTSDNIPGVPGVGEKTAAKLMAEYGSLDAVLEHAGEIKGKVGENLREHAETARVSRTVATIRRDAPVDVDLATVTWGDFDEAALLRVFGELQFTSLTDRVFASANRAGARADGRAGAQTNGGEERGVYAATETPPLAQDAVPATVPGSLPIADAASTVWPFVRDDQARTLVRTWLGESGESLVLGVSRDVCPGDTLLPSDDCAVAGNGRIAIVNTDVDEFLVDVLTHGRIASADLKALMLSVDEPGAVPGQRGDCVLDAFDPARFDDVGIAAYLLESNRSSYELQGLYGETFCRRLGAESQGGCAGADARAAAELAPALRARLKEDGSLACYVELELPLIPVLARMERHGVGLDIGVLRALAVETRDRIDVLRSEIHELAGVDFNVDSPKQLSEVLFETLGLPSGKRTKTGYSTDAQVLSGLAPAYPIAARIMDYRELTKLTSTYIEALPKLIGADKRLHTTFNQTVAATGRLSSSNPNLQNIPVRSELGKRIRAAFVPAREGDLIVSADYSQIELRILAHLSEDAGLVEAFTSGADFHAATAARVFGVDADAITPEHRRRAKAVNFGIVYGISAHGLSESLSIGRAEAQEMIDRYFAAYPGVRTYLDRVMVGAHRDGYATTLFGRRRRIPELASGNHNLRSFGERTAMNHPMQGTAADIMKAAMIAVDRRLREERMAAWMLLQVHDELVFEAPPEELSQLTVLVRAEMANAANLRVPLVVSVSSGANWALAK